MTRCYSINVGTEAALEALLSGKTVTWSSDKSGNTVRTLRIGHSSLWPEQDRTGSARFAVQYGSKRKGFGTSETVGYPAVAAAAALDIHANRVAILSR